jgi:FkbM family methyltransferase
MGCKSSQMLNKLLSKTRQIRAVSKLAPSFSSKTFLVWWALWMALRHRIGVKQERAGKLRLQYRGKDFHFYSSYSTDLSVIEEVFIKEVYKLADISEPKIIFDLGSNTGVTVKFFELQFPQASIYAFEPDPQVFKSLERNFKNSPLVHTLNVAVTGEDKQIDFYIHPKSPIVSSVSPRFGGEKKISVVGKSLSTLTKELNVQDIDLVKFDVEGAEREIFSSFDTKQIKALVGELHTDLAGLSLEGFKALFPMHEVRGEKLSAIRYAIFAQRKN